MNSVCFTKIRANGKMAVSDILPCITLTPRQEDIQVYSRRLRPTTRGIFYTQALGWVSSRMHEVTSLCACIWYKGAFQDSLSRDEQ